MPEWTPFREPVRATARRTLSLAALGGLALALAWGRLAWWPAATAVALWPALGGHWVEVGFLNGLRPRLPARRAAQVAGRLAVWFVSGAVLGIAMRWTAGVLTQHRARLPLTWWVAGLGFVGVEVMVHLAANAAGRPSFVDGRA